MMKNMVQKYNRILNRRKSEYWAEDSKILDVWKENTRILNMKLSEYCDSIIMDLFVIFRKMAGKRPAGLRRTASFFYGNNTFFSPIKSNSMKT
jgi:hypothetical protein